MFYINLLNESVNFDSTKINTSDKEVICLFKETTGPWQIYAHF